MPYHLLPLICIGWRMDLSLPKLIGMESVPYHPLPLLCIGWRMHLSLVRIAILHYIIELILPHLGVDAIVPLVKRTYPIISQVDVLRYNG